MLTVQLLRANGCRVVGLDYDPQKLSLARQFGAEVVNLSENSDPLQLVKTYSKGRGVDAVIVATATKSNEPINNAALMCRKRGRVVLVGTSGLEISRDYFFKKEISFQVSSSYGPGRYDPNYEEKGQDYPIAYVRWTEQRNFEAVLDMLADGHLNIHPLITHRFDIDEAYRAYDQVTRGDETLGILLKYPGIDIISSQRSMQLPVIEKSSIKIHAKKQNKVTVSFLGAGSYASAALIPAFKRTNISFSMIASKGGLSGLHVGKKFGFNSTTTDTEEVFLDKGSDAIVIATQHDSHADFVIKGLKAGKHVFVEKPICLTKMNWQN